MMRLRLPWKLTPAKDSELPFPSDATGDNSYEARVQRHEYQMRLAKKKDARWFAAFCTSLIAWFSPVLYRMGEFVLPILYNGWLMAPLWLKLFFSLTPLPVLVGLIALMAAKEVKKIKDQRP